MTYIVPTRSFFQRDPVLVARELIGAKLVHYLPDSEAVGGIIIETEAYLAAKDKAAHNQRGQTNATKALYMQAGTLYIHHMRGYYGMDIVTETEMLPSSVLIRALMPTDGIERMKRARGVTSLDSLANGPGKLCEALSINIDFNCKDILDPRSCLKLTIPTTNSSSTQISASGRIGVTKDQDFPLRFFLTENKDMSAQPSPSRFK